MKSSLTLKDKVYNLIMEDILSHQYSAEDVINEKNLVERYGYSKTPIREALLSLCNDNVLRSIPRYGYEIVRLTMDDVRSMLQYRYAVEGQIVARNIEKFGRNQVARLAEVNDRCTNAADMWEHWAHNTEFHTLMLTFAGNPYAAQDVRKCMNQLKRAYAQLCWDNPDAPGLSTDTKNHELMLECLLQHDAEAFQRILRDDLNDFAGGSRDLAFVPGK